MFDDARTCGTFDTIKSSFESIKNSGFSQIIWHFSDDQGCRIAFDSVLGVGCKPSFTKREVRELLRFATGLGLTIIPELASLGHSRYLTRLPSLRHLNENDTVFSGMCPVHPQTREVLSKLIRETIELFDPPAVHVGLDEVDIGQHPLTAAALQSTTKAQLIADHIVFLHDLVVREAGREMWMWADGVLAEPAMLTSIPKDIVLCNWQYKPGVGKTATQTLLDAGFDVIVASGLLTYEQPLFPSCGYALRNVQETGRQLDLVGQNNDARVRGHLVTTWIPSRSITSAQRLAWHLAGEIVRDGEAFDQVAAIRRFGQEHFGFTSTDAWLAVAQTLIDCAPERAEWLSVIKLKLDTMPVKLKDSLRELAEHWTFAADALPALRALVKAHLEDFDALQLLLDLLQHAYSSAAKLALCDGTGDDEATLATLREERIELHRRLSADWDRERFADDPAKHTPVISFFRDEHLLLIVDDGLKSITSRLEQLLLANSLSALTVVRP